MRKLHMILMLWMSITLPAMGQICIEDFTGENGQGATGSFIIITTADWTIDVSGANLTGGSYFKVDPYLSFGSAFVGRKLKGRALWYSPVCDISTGGKVNASLDWLISQGVTASDSVAAYYILDGGPPVLFESNGKIFGNNFSSVTTTTKNLIGSTLQVMVEMTNQGILARQAFDNVSIQTFCFPPSMPVSSISGSNVTEMSMDLSWAAGDGTHRLVVMRAGQPVDALPVDGVSYAADATFGDGDDLGSGQYVVYSGTGSGTTVTGLSVSTRYYFAAFEYNDGGTPCYYDINPATGDEATDCGSLLAPPPPVNFTASPYFEQITLNWTAPACFGTQVLILASESPIVGTPTGSPAQYQADPGFGDGTGSMGFELSPDPVYPVLMADATSVTVTGLTNGTTYYFKAFTYKNPWSLTAAEVSATPGCPDLNGDVLFINEIDYVGSSGMQGTGFEIVGPAGTDLSNYRYTIYNDNGNSIGGIQTFDLLTIPDENNTGFGAVWESHPLQNNTTGIAIFNIQTNKLVQFISYEGVITAINGDAFGATSVDIGVEDTNDSGDNMSLQLTGNAPCPSGLTWSGPSPSTMGVINTGQVLPVELISFRGDLAGEDVRLSWQTAYELNNDFFEVQHSTDGKLFMPLGFVNGAGTTDRQQDYQYLHLTPGPGVHYYRLRQVDFDGRQSFSEIVALRMAGGEDAPVVVFPNPNSGRFQVRLTNAATDNYRLELLNSTGQRLNVHFQRTDTGFDVFLPANAPAGLYFLQITGRQQQYRQTVVVR